MESSRLQQNLTANTPHQCCQISKGFLAKFHTKIVKISQI